LWRDRRLVFRCDEKQKYECRSQSFEVRIED
jgi:hypothetical protein